MKFIDLTHPLKDATPSFPGDPVMKVMPHVATAKGDKCNVSNISLGSHQGTHLDAMFHFVPEGKRIHEMPLHWFYGPATVLRIPKRPREEITVDDFKPFEARLTPGARIIYETGWHRQYGQPNYFTDFPSLTQEAARYLAERGIRLLGMDVPTPGRDYLEVHHILLGKPTEIVVVESLANLDQLPDDFIFIGFPLRFNEGDGSPIRAIGLVE